MKYGHGLAAVDEERQKGVQRVRLAAYWYDKESQTYVPFSGLTVIGKMRVKKLRQVMEEVGRVMAETEKTEG